jgi:hypothetical protein
MCPNDCPLIVFLPLAYSLYSLQCAAEMSENAGLCHDHTTNQRKLRAVAVALKGDAWVFVSSNRSAALAALAALAMLAALGGCADNNFDLASSWFSRPFDLSASKGGYTYSNLSETKQEHPITANDLVDANGACPRLAAPAPMQPGSIEGDSLVGGGVAIGMSECDVVARLGQPNAVNLGRSPNADRTAVLTFNSGPRPGIYRFTGGRLMEMDRVEAPPPPPEPAKKKVVKKKPAQPQEPSPTGSKT